ncbi:MAG: helix-turn-helix domain-containing protein [Cyclobacteriaceae bacterium]
MSQICLDPEFLVKSVETNIDHTCPGYQGKSKDVWIDDDEAMNLLRITSKTTLQKLRDTDKIQFSKVTSKIILYNRESIEQLLEENKNKALK